MDSGLLGIGRGVTLVPVMCHVLSFPIHFAIPTSMFTMIFTSVSGVANHIQQGT
ncbi:sulfite exporter TauE/SafE family protein [Candidatus Bathyarchaeota archaeon]|nr:sulfite exporter TauE/SafE family protein [Candidatus Bathyarchaeota archaeon]